MAIALEMDIAMAMAMATTMPPPRLPLTSYDLIFLKFNKLAEVGRPMAGLCQLGYFSYERTLWMVPGYGNSASVLI